MLIHITVKIGDREEVLSQEVVGTASQREELAHRFGRRVGCLVAQAALQEQAEQLSRPHCCGHPMENRGWRTKTLQGLDGPLLIRRRRYRCRRCGREHLPADAHQQCGSHRLTRPLAKRICQLATIEHFTHLPQLVFDQHGVSLAHEEMIGIVHEIGGQAERMRRADVEQWNESGRKSWPSAKVTPERLFVSCDGILFCTNESEPDPEHPGQNRMLWRQMRVGCVSWQDEKGSWHKRLTWGRESAEEFGASLYRLACECGYREAKETVFSADGGEWCWEICLRYFSESERILDWYHASEHVWSVSRVLFPDSTADQRTWSGDALSVLECGGGCGLVDWLKSRAGPHRGKKRKALGRLLRYVQSHEQFMDYPSYREQGLPIGTGMMESSCRQLVGLRLKGPGMHWSESGALAMTALRAQSINENWNPFWETLVL